MFETLWNKWTESQSVNSSCHWWCPHELHIWPISSSALHSHTAHMCTVGPLLSPILSSSLFSPPSFSFSLWFFFPSFSSYLLISQDFFPFFLIWYSFLSYSTSHSFSLFVIPPSVVSFLIFFFVSLPLLTCSFFL